MGWPGTSLSRSRLELSRYSRPNRERDFFDAFPCPMARFGAAGRKRHPGIVLVLEHRRQRHDVSLFYLSTRSGRNSRVSAKLDDLHPQFDADPKTEVRFHRRRALAKTARDTVDRGELQASL